MRRAGVVVAAEGLAAAGVAVALVVRGLAGADQRVVNGFGTAACFALIAAAVLAAGWALWTGRRWGRGVAVFAQLLLLPVAWYLAAGHQPAAGIAVGVVAVGALALLFSPAALRWASGADERPDDKADTQDPASSDSAGPDTR